MKKIVAILDNDSHHQTQMRMALQGAYSVQAYGTPAAAFSGMQTAWPDLVIVAPQVGTSSGLSVIRDLKRDNRFISVPVIYIAETHDSRLHDQLQLVGVVEMLVKPVDFRVLPALAARLLASREVESGWKDLPHHQRRALEGGLSAFNNVARDLAEGRQPAMGPIAEACESLVEVIAQEQLAPLLQRFRNHDNFTYVHSMRYSAFMGLFAKSIGLPKALQVQVAIGGLMHDMGMMTIPPYVLNKRGPLTPADWKQVHNHVSVGHRLLQAMGSAGKGVEIIINQHHERLDGAGYPNGLRGSQLNELARMAGIIDVFCALTDRRPYKDPMTAAAALELMANTMDSQLDCDLLPRFRDILLDTVPDLPEGPPAHP
jgi:HD-GYP domain-containing protein (c-di-GMP phosphodiesterase class II)